MMRRLRTAFLVLLAAALGAVLGRVAFQAREKMEAGEPVSELDPSRITLRPQDFIPGIVAAFRVGDAPWSWFHIPPWLAAFAVNAGVGAFGGDVTRLKERAERAAFQMAGLDARDFGLGGDWEEEEDAEEDRLYDVSGSAGRASETPSSGPSWTSPPPPPPPSSPPPPPPPSPTSQQAPAPPPPPNVPPTGPAGT